jgi:aldehyde:ferredoxin oxidoreductase
MRKGYNGKILRVNLTDKKWKIEEPDEVFYRTYLGGGALATYYLLKELKPGVDPLSPENILIFSTSVVTGAPLSGLSRYTVAAKSPLTGGYGESESSGFFGPELKFTGFDAVVIEGRAAKPSYLWIRDGKVELRPAEHLWGLETGPAAQKIKEELGEKLARIAIIGPAGEKLVRFACVLNELKHANGRTGMGAVMGSKNLKAVVARGSSKQEVADIERFMELSKIHNETISNWGPNKTLKKLGTANLIMALNTQGILPTHNFHTGFMEKAENISGEKMAETILKSGESCYACGVRCKRAVEIPSGPFATSSIYGGPEYETLSSLGSLLDIDNLEAIAKGNELCNRYGLDTISTGVALGFVMECFEAGILTKEDTYGVDFRFGNAEAMVQGIEWIGERRPGLGELLGEGVERAAAKIGKGSEKFALHIKGQELPMHDPRGKTGQGMSFALSPTGADHIEAPHDTPFGQAGPMMERIAPLGLLEPVPPPGPHAPEGAQLCLSPFCLVALQLPGESAISRRHRSGGSRSINWWISSGPSRVGIPAYGSSSRSASEPSPWPGSSMSAKGSDARTIGSPTGSSNPWRGGALKGQKIDRRAFEEAITMYYEAMGWDPKEGIPTRGKLAELNLSWADELIRDKRK